MKDKQKSQEQVNAYLDNIESGLSKNEIIRRISAEFNLSESTAKRRYKESGLEVHTTPEIVSAPKAEIVSKDEIYNKPLDLSKKQIYLEARDRLTNIARHAIYEKDKIAAQKELIKLVQSPDYVEVMGESKEKPSLKDIGILASSLFLGSTPDKIKQLKVIKNKKKASK